MTDPHYRVDVQAGSLGCPECKAGRLWTVVYVDGEEDIELGTAWTDKDDADDMCDLMNGAFEAGTRRVAEADRAAALKVLLTWAVEFVERETDQLMASFRDHNGDIYDADVSVELTDALRWLAEAREVLK